MKLHTKAVHAGDRKPAHSAIPVTTPIVTASSYVYERMETLDQVFAEEVEGYCYARYDSPTAHGLEELVTALESGHGSLATSSGMNALQFALQTALTDRRRSVVASNALYGATISQLMKVFEPMAVEVRWVDICDLAAVEQALAEARPGCVVMETISNPLLRVGAMDRIAALCRQAGAALIVDNTFATPLLVRPIERGANLVVHSLTKYLAGHGDVLGGVIVSDADHYPMLRSLSKILGPNLGPFESYLSMRGIKTFPLRMERQCANAIRLATALRAHPRIERVHFPDDPAHPDAETIARLLPAGLYGAMISFAIRDAGRDEVFAFMNRLKLVVRGTSLGDVHTLMLYPAMSSHRDISPRQRQRLGIGDNLVRLSVGIEDPGDIAEDLTQALG
ncbi:MAG: PLP-dependent transferase [Acidobacteria bacterium]|nr:PLP-dependent transferase [Acidobacteriota bacterium]